MPTKHALLSASSSDRWIHCPPSARLSESYEDKGSDYAAEGTDAHSLCEFKLKTALGMEADDPTDGLTYYDQKWTMRYRLCSLCWNRSSRQGELSDRVVLSSASILPVEQGLGNAIVIADGTRRSLTSNMVSALGSPRKTRR